MSRQQVSDYWYPPKPPKQMTAYQLLKRGIGRPTRAERQGRLERVVDAMREASREINKEAVSL